MKKVLIGLLIACLTFSFVACEMDTIQKVGQTMGSFGNNVYGIKPNMDQVNAATSTVNESVKVLEDGQVTIDFPEIINLATDIQAMKDSPAKKEAIQNEMKQPIVAEPEDLQKIKGTLERQMDEVIADMAHAVDTLPEETPTEVKSLLGSVASNLNGIVVSENPTKAELVAISLVSNLSNVIKEKTNEITGGTEQEKIDAGLALADEALKTLDTINTINEEFDLLAGIDIASLLDDLDEAKGKDLEELDDDEKMILDFANGLLDAIGRNKDGSLNKDNFDRFASDQVIKRAAYEAGAYGLALYQMKPLIVGDQMSKDAFLFDITLVAKYQEKDKFTINDLISYLISYIFTDIYAATEYMLPYGECSLYDYLNALAMEDEEKLNAIVKIYEEHYEDALNVLLTNFKMEKRFVGEGFAKINTMVNTVLTLMLEAGYKDIYYNFEQEIVDGATDFMNELLGE